MGQLSTKEKENAVNEVRILASIKYFLILLNLKYSHPQIIAYKQAFFEDSTSSLCIVMDYAEGGDLMGKINAFIKSKGHFPEDALWQMFIQMVSGLKSLHDLKICHRDLKVTYFIMLS